LSFNFIANSARRIDSLTRAADSASNLKNGISWLLSWAQPHTAVPPSISTAL
jgi:hypothetical protein